ncbi:MAG TPA: hypothetical protein VEZ90_14690, partial [Blastocatellia bacterium]|nr:hypothetical protein [Blastocatellia bacterium]
MTSPYPVSIAVLAFIVLGGVSAGPAESTFRTQNRPGLFRAEISGSITIRGAAANGLPVELASEEDGQESNGISTGSTDQAG